MSEKPAELRFANLIFDFDGTLVDSFPGIEASLRVALRSCQPDRLLETETLRARVGPPLPAMLQALWPDLGSEEVTALVTAFRAHYLPEGCLHTELFPEVARTLERLAAAGAHLFVLTNKPHAPTHAILSRLGLLERFVEVSCSDDARFPFASKSEGAVKLARRRSLPPEATLLVGDAPDDARAAAAGGFAFVGAGYGYGRVGHGIGSGKEVVIVGSFAELADLLLSPSPDSCPHDHSQRFR